jgi:hypothetical protein
MSISLFTRLTSTTSRPLTQCVCSLSPQRYLILSLDPFGPFLVSICSRDYSKSDAWPWLIVDISPPFAVPWLGHDMDSCLTRAFFFAAAGTVRLPCRNHHCHTDDDPPPPRFRFFSPRSKLFFYGSVSNLFWTLWFSSFPHKSTKCLIVYIVTLFSLYQSHV